MPTGLQAYRGNQDARRILGTLLFVNKSYARVIAEVIRLKFTVYNKMKI